MASRPTTTSKDKVKSSSKSRKEPQLGVVTPDVVWNGVQRNPPVAGGSSATKHVPPAAGDDALVQSPPTDKRSPGAGDEGRYNVAAAPPPQQQQQQGQPKSSRQDSPGGAVASPPDQKREGSSSRHKSSRDKTKEVSSPSAKEQAAAKSQAASNAAAQNAAFALRAPSAFHSDELNALKEENAQLHEIERQFWYLLDEREQLQEEVRNLKNGIHRGTSIGGGGGVGSTSGGGMSSALVRFPHEVSEAEKNFQQMATALDEALSMLLQLDKTASSRVSGAGGSNNASVVTPGTLIHRFLDFCSAERLGTATAGPHTSPSSSSNFAARTANLVQSLQQDISAASHADPTVAGNNSSMQAVSHSASLSQALRLAQDEINHLKMELDRSDLSRLQALDDVDKMQNQVSLLSKSVVELRSAYASARAQADANAKSAETVHEVTVRLAERDAEIAHLKARIAEMQRLNASGGNALASDTARIRAELQARVTK